MKKLNAYPERGRRQEELPAELTVSASRHAPLPALHGVDENHVVTLTAVRQLFSLGVRLLLLALKKEKMRTTKCQFGEVNRVVLSF
jgi:hypothetical protein